MSCPDCDIYKMRMSDYMKSHLLMQQQIVLTIRAYRWIAVGTAALFFCIGRWTS